jgi:hypothetical protein
MNQFEELCKLASKENWCWNLVCTTCGHLHFKYSFLELASGKSPTDSNWLVHCRSTGYQKAIWYGQKKIDTLPRLRGEGKNKINYRHLIDSLIRKPGAFENYRYRDAMFPTSRFRIAYDSLKKHYTLKSAAKRYLGILNIAAKESETAVDNALRILIDKDMDICKSQVQTLIQSNEPVYRVEDIDIPEIDLTAYDQLLEEEMSC